MNSTFGERLRLHREERQISLAVVSEQTKIKLSLLEALERDDLSHWPLGLFGRSYIRSYAQAIGLDPDEVVHEFLERFPDPGAVESEQAPPEPRRSATSSGDRIDIVLRFSVPRIWVSWAVKLTALARFVPRRQH